MEHDVSTMVINKYTALCILALKINTDNSLLLEHITGHNVSIFECLIELQN